MSNELPKICPVCGSPTEITQQSPVDILTDMRTYPVVVQCTNNECGWDEEHPELAE